MFKDAIIERERQRHAHNMERIRLEQGIQDMQEDNARYIANAQHERESVLKEIEKVCFFYYFYCFFKTYTYLVKVFYIYLKDNGLIFELGRS